MITNITSRSLVRAIKAETSGLPALTDGVAEIIERVEELHTSETSTSLYQRSGLLSLSKVLTCDI